MNAGDHQPCPFLPTFDLTLFSQASSSIRTATIPPNASTPLPFRKPAWKSRSIITITREENRLYLQATAQPKFELFAETDKDFFLKVVDAQVTFVTDATGRVTKLILHQNGMDQDAKRIE